jgi:hypothetical protein
MTLPTFLGIGAPRAGTTWLNELLRSHPDVYTPTLRDEIRFFDQYYERGLVWYETLFCPPEEASTYQAIGEVSPQYLECEECPERIFTTLPSSKLIVILRHPVDRAYSQYGFYVQRRNYRGSFQDFVATKPRALERGFYSRYLQRYLRYFDRSAILALLFEEVFEDISKTKQALSAFLQISADRFPAFAGSEKVNPSSVPRHQFLYGVVAKSGRELRRRHLEPVVDFVMRTRLQAILGRGAPLPPLDVGVRRILSRRYRDEFGALEECMDIDLTRWRQADERAGCR